MSKTETPDYTVVTAFDNIELRRYNALLTVQVHLNGERSDVLQRGFKHLSNFIFGDNLSREPISMTTPVLQQQRDEKNEGWVAFVMPSHFTQASLPVPCDDTLSVTVIPAATYLTLRFSGHANDHTIDKYRHKLDAFIEHHQITTLDTPIYAYYSPPWTPPMLKRNEIWISVQNESVL